MAVTVNVYNHTTRRFADGTNAPGDALRLMLCTAATFNAANTTLAGITKTEVANGNGYTTYGQALTGATVTTVTTNDAIFDANDVIWTASGGAITASYAILFNSSYGGDPPLFLIDFGGSVSASSGADFRVIWNSGGIFSFTLT